MNNGGELILHRKSFRQLTTDELYELLRVRSEVFVVEQRSSYSNYEQNYVLPDDVVKDKISAKVEDGILTITMPKTEPKEKVTKAIEVS